MEQYDMDKILGEGTYGVVYSAIQKSSKRQVAIKQFRRGKFKDGINFTALREIKLQMELHHPNITELLDVFVDNDTVNLVFEFLPLNLDNIIKSKEIVLSPNDIKSYIQMILEGIEYCHEQYILHRDLKPDNLLIDSKTGNIKIADFGLARIYGSPNRNMTSMVCTLWYRPPELLFGAKEYNGNVDIWGVGCILAELILRSPLFPGTTEMDQLGKIFQILGTPTEEDWENVVFLPNYIEFTKNSGIPFSSIFRGASNDLLDLLSKLLICNPLKRITAKEALSHPYFSNDPPATPKENLPKSVNI